MSNTLSWKTCQEYKNSISYGWTWRKGNITVIKEDIPVKTSKKTGLAKYMVSGLDKSDGCSGKKS